jgi:hypothetical protein
MTYNYTANARKSDGHFEPEASLDPQEMRALRSHLEQIDYAAFAANREILGQAIGTADLARFGRMAVTTAQARARWVSAALAVMDKGEGTTPEDINRLAALRRAYEELTEAYEGMRRMVERGYLQLKKK